MAFSQFGGHVYWDKAGVINRTPQALEIVRQPIGLGAGGKSNGPSRSCPTTSNTLIKVEADKRDDAQRAALRDYFVQFAYAKIRAQFEPLNKQLDDLRKSEGELNRAVPITMVMQENPQMRDTFVLVRGDFRSKGERVTRGVPASLPPLPAGAPDNRLGLAHVAGRSRQSARGPRDRESLLAAVLRHGHRQDQRRLRLAGRMADASRIARLAGRRIRRLGLGRQGAAAADRHVGHLSAVGQGRPANCWSTILTTGCWRAGRGFGWMPK